MPARTAPNKSLKLTWRLFRRAVVCGEPRNYDYKPERLMQVGKGEPLATALRSGMASRGSHRTQAETLSVRRVSEACLAGNPFGRMSLVRRGVAVRAAAEAGHHAARSD
jgi:hypothetical protein